MMAKARAAVQMPEVGLDTLMVFSLSGWNADVAADFWGRQLRCSGGDFAVEDLPAAVQEACLRTDDETMASLFERLDAHGTSAAARAVRHYVEHGLYLYVVEQNQEKGVAPGREQMAAECIRLLANLPSDVPSQVVDHLRAIFCGPARGVRKWLAKWRVKWGARIGKLRLSELIPTHLVQRKAGLLSPQHAWYADSLKAHKLVGFFSSLFVTHHRYFPTLQ